MESAAPLRIELFLHRTLKGEVGTLIGNLRVPPNLDRIRDIAQQLADAVSGARCSLKLLWKDEDGDHIMLTDMDDLAEVRLVPRDDFARPLLTFESWSGTQGVS